MVVIFLGDSLNLPMALCIISLVSVCLNHLSDHNMRSKFRKMTPASVIETGKMNL